MECSKKRAKRGCGHVVSVLVFYSDDPSLNPVEIDRFSVNCLK